MSNSFSAIPFPIQFDTLHSSYTPFSSLPSSFDSDSDSEFTEYPFEPHHSDYDVSLRNSQLDLNADPMQLDLNADPIQLDLNAEPPLFDLNSETSQSDSNPEPLQFSDDFDCWGFESTEIFDDFPTYMEELRSPIGWADNQMEANTGGLRFVGFDLDSDSEVMYVNTGDDNLDILEASLWSDFANEEDRWNQYENQIRAMTNFNELELPLASLTVSASGEEEEHSNMNVDDSITEILFFGVDFTHTESIERSGAAKMVVQNLPVVNLRKEDMVVCTICRDEMGEGEFINQLPCSHYYHRDCIVPWLELKNTCPVCRFELPFDERQHEAL